MVDIERIITQHQHIIGADTAEGAAQDVARRLRPVLASLERVDNPNLPTVPPQDQPTNSNS